MGGRPPRYQQGLIEVGRRRAASRGRRSVLALPLKNRRRHRFLTSAFGLFLRVLALSGDSRMPAVTMQPPRKLGMRSISIAPTCQQREPGTWSADGYLPSKLAAISARTCLEVPTKLEIPTKRPTGLPTGLRSTLPSTRRGREISRASPTLWNGRKRFLEPGV